MLSPGGRFQHAAPSRRSSRRPLAQRLFLGIAAAVAVSVAVAGLVSLADGGRAGVPARSHPAASGTARHQAQVRPTASAPPGRPELPSLSPAQMAGQRVIYSYNGLRPPHALLDWISHGEVAGVIFFSPNIASDAQIAGVISELQRANASTHNPLRSLPLLLMTDQEGGLVRRLPGAPVMSEKQIGESASAAAEAKAAGTSAGANLAGVGMNVNLAPVLDVYRTPGDFDDQFGRSYSMNPREVAHLGAQFITAQQRLRVAATAKHFPGLGAAMSWQDTDERPVILNVPLHALRTIDEYPYLAAIAAKVKLVMVSWAIYPALDPRRPAGFSPAVIEGELRQRLGFPGVTITDALEAGALRPFGGIGHRAALAAGAGMDLLLCSGQQISEGEQARTALEDGYRSGKLPRDAFQDSVRRIVALRSGLAR